MQFQPPRRTTKSFLALFIAFLLTLTAASRLAQARKFKVLHTFHGGKHDGADTGGGLVRDNAGNLYGTTAYGGTGGCQYGCGTVFKLNKAGKLVWLYSFKGGNGAAPAAGLLRDARGNLFGTTLYGGITNCSQGCGTVFKLNGTGTKEALLHKFTYEPDGYYPQSLLVEDATGSVYGTTTWGGKDDRGTVFKVDANGKETVLHNFTGGSDGCIPAPGVILDAAGNLYGAATRGGDGDCNSGQGVVFKVDTAGNETVLYTFGGLDGALPGSVLLFDSKGNLYGTTVYGGSNYNDEQCYNGCGTVFELSPQSGGNWSEKVLYNFCSLTNCTDGEEPDTGPLVRDSKGNLYGTTYFGGDINLCNGSCGVVYKLDTAGNETVLHTFTGGSDGAFPVAGLAVDRSGNLYGTTQGGGAACLGSFTCGVVFKVAP
jgi:uncharacterized repeat protein (TIGR03803 family)